MIQDNRTQEAGLLNLRFTDLQFNYFRYLNLDGRFFKIPKSDF